VSLDGTKQLNATDNIEKHRLGSVLFLLAEHPRTQPSMAQDVRKTRPYKTSLLANRFTTIDRQIDANYTREQGRTDWFHEVV